MIKRRRRGATILAKPASDQWWKIGMSVVRWLGQFLALVGFVAGCYWLSQKVLDPALFPLRHVHLEGKLRNLSKADMQQVVRAYLGQNFFVLDIDALHGHFAANPWISQVNVRRRWPDTLEISFQERTPFGHWGENEMVDIHGERFRPGSVRQPGPWPQLMGPDGHERTLIRVHREASVLFNQVGLKLVQLIQDERRAWRMVFANGIEIWLGKEHLMQRLRRFVDIYPQILSERTDQVAVVDLRYTNGFAVRWKTETITAS
jgi:cell division protein FtsQ